MIGFTSPSIAGKERRRPISAELLVVPDFSVIEIVPSVPGYVLDRSSGFFVGKCLLLDRFLAGHTLWRMKDCPFCYHTPSGVWLESSSALALWDGFPISEGHTLVVPRCHVCSLFDLSDSELSLVWGFVARVREDLKIRLRVDAFNIGLNDGRAAGQTAPWRGLGGKPASFADDRTRLTGRWESAPEHTT